MKRYQKSRILIVGFLLALCIFFTATYVDAASKTITVKVDCVRPKAGVYSLGWGTSRLIVPEEGNPYSTFRMMKKEKTDGQLCQAGDNSGAVFLRDDRTVWAYTKSD